jgi:pilus assembly protein CpaF
MTTIHANTPRDALARLEQMVGMAGFAMSQASIRTHIASAIAIVMQLSRLSDGTRRTISVSEITGMEGDVIQMQEIFHFVPRGIDAERRVLGEFKATGIRSKFLDKLKMIGINVDTAYFDPSRAL